MRGTLRKKETMKQLTRYSGILSLLVLIGLTGAIATQADDWRQFRGSNSSGLARDSTLPTNLTKDHILWRQSLPGRGLSTPIVVGNRVFVTAADGPEQERLMVLCFDAGTGERLWERTVWATGRTMCHEKTCVAAPTPVSDGEVICALYSSNDLVCFDLDGNLRWLRGLTLDYPNASNSLGMSSSPVLVGDTVVVQIENDSQSLALGLDKGTGRNLWRLDRPKGANWTSPVVLGLDTAPSAVALQSRAGIHVVDAVSGKVLAQFTNGASTIPSSVRFGSTLFIPSNGITAVDLSDLNGELSTVWNSRSLRPDTASPIVAGGHLFTVNGAGVLTCGDLRQGGRVWNLRLKGPFSASPVGTESTLYWVNERGLIQVVDISVEGGHILGDLDLDSTVLGTPAIANGALFLRSDEQLWKIGDRQLL